MRKAQRILSNGQMGIRDGTGQLLGQNNDVGDAEMANATDTENPAKGLAALSPAERAENIAKAQAARALKAETRRRATFRTDFLDMNYWERAASALKVRLPPPGESPTPSVMRRFLNRVGWSVPKYYAWSGDKALTDFARLNPQWPARAWGGLVIEAVIRQRGTVVPEQQALDC